MLIKEKPAAKLEHARIKPEPHPFATELQNSCFQNLRFTPEPCRESMEDPWSSPPAPPSSPPHPPLSLFALALLWRSHKVRPPAAIYKCPTLFLPLSPRSPCHQLSPSKSGRAVYPGSRRRDVSPRCDASHARRQKTPDAIHTCGISKFPHHHSVTRARARVHALGRTQVVKKGHKNTHASRWFYSSATCGRGLRRYISQGSLVLYIFIRLDTTTATTTTTTAIHSTLCLSCLPRNGADRLPGKTKQRFTASLVAAVAVCFFVKTLPLANDCLAAYL